MCFFRSYHAQEILPVQGTRPARIWRFLVTQTTAPTYLGSLFAPRGRQDHVQEWNGAESEHTLFHRSGASLGAKEDTTANLGGHKSPLAIRPIELVYIYVCVWVGVHVEYEKCYSNTCGVFDSPSLHVPSLTSLVLVLFYLYAQQPGSLSVLPSMGATWGYSDLSLIGIELKTRFFSQTGHISHAQETHVACSCHNEQHRYRTFASLQKVLWDL